MFRRIADEAESSLSTLRRVGDQMEAAGRSLSLAVTAPLVAMATVALKTAIDFESAFAGVQKTVNATEFEFQALERGILEMSRTVPLAATELSKIAALGGQFGVAKEDLLGFTETVARLSVAIDGISAEEAAASLAQFGNVTGLAADDMDNLVSTLIRLGNEGSSSEKQILELATRLAAAGTQAGLSQAQIMGLAAALADVGLEAEAGGTAVSRVLREMSDAVKTGNENLKVFAAVAGQTGDAFAKMFQAAPMQAFEAFVTGLGDLQKSGQSLTPIFEKLELADVRLLDAMSRLALTSDDLGGKFRTAMQEFQSGTALLDESNRRFQTTESQLKLLTNEVQLVARELGAALIPMLLQVMTAVRDVIPVLADMVRAFEELSPGAQTAVVAIVAFVAALGPALIIFGELAKGIAAVVALMPALTAAFGVLIPILIAGAAATAALDAAFATLGSRVEEVQRRGGSFWEQLAKASLAEAAVLVFEKLAVATTDAAAGMETLGTNTGTAMKHVGDSIDGFRDWSDEQKQIFAELEKENAEWARQLEKPLDLGPSKEEIKKLEAEAKRLDTTLEGLTKRVITLAIPDTAARAIVELRMETEKLVAQFPQAETKIRAAAAAIEAMTLTQQEQKNTMEALKQEWDGFLDSLGQWVPGLKELKDGFGALETQLLSTTNFFGKIGDALTEVPAKASFSEKALDGLSGAAGRAGFSLDGASKVTQTFAETLPHLESAADKAAFMLDNVERAFAGMGKTGDISKVLVQNYADALEEIGQKAELLGLNFDVMGAKVKAAQDNFNATFNAVNDGLAPMAALTEAAQDLNEAIAEEEFSKAIDEMMLSVTDTFTKMANGLIAGTLDIGQAFKDLGQSLIANFAQLVIHQVFDPILKAAASFVSNLFSMITKGGEGVSGGGITGWLGALFSGSPGAGAGGPEQLAGPGWVGPGVGAPAGAGAGPGGFNITSIPGVSALANLGGTWDALVFGAQTAWNALSAGESVFTALEAGASSFSATIPAAVANLAVLTAAVGDLYALYTGIVALTEGRIGTGVGTLGGLAVGAGVGFLVGGPIGALVGAGIGAALGGLVGGFFDEDWEAIRRERARQRNLTGTTVLGAAIDRIQVNSLDALNANLRTDIGGGVSLGDLLQRMSTWSATFEGGIEFKVPTGIAETVSRYLTEQGFTGKDFTSGRVGSITELIAASGAGDIQAGVDAWQQVLEVLAAFIRLSQQLEPLGLTFGDLGDAAMRSRAEVAFAIMSLNDYLDAVGMSAEKFSLAGINLKETDPADLIRPWIDQLVGAFLASPESMAKGAGLFAAQAKKDSETIEEATVSIGDALFNIGVLFRQLQQAGKEMTVTETLTQTLDVIEEQMKAARDMMDNFDPRDILAGATAAAELIKMKWEAIGAAVDILVNHINNLTAAIAGSAEAVTKWAGLFQDVGFNFAAMTGDLIELSESLPTVQARLTALSGAISLIGAQLEMAIPQGGAAVRGVVETQVPPLLEALETTFVHIQQIEDPSARIAALSALLDQLGTTSQMATAALQESMDRIQQAIFGAAEAIVQHASTLAEVGFDLNEAARVAIGLSGGARDLGTQLAGLGTSLDLLAVSASAAITSMDPAQIQGVLDNWGSWVAGVGDAFNRAMAIGDPAARAEALTAVMSLMAQGLEAAKQAVEAYYTAIINHTQNLMDTINGIASSLAQAGGAIASNAEWLSKAGVDIASMAASMAAFSQSLPTMEGTLTALGSSIQLFNAAVDTSQVKVEGLVSALNEFQAAREGGQDAGALFETINTTLAGLPVAFGDAFGKAMALQDPGQRLEALTGILENLGTLLNALPPDMATALVAAFGPEIGMLVAEIQKAAGEQAQAAQAAADQLRELMTGSGALNPENFIQMNVKAMADSLDAIVKGAGPLFEGIGNKLGEAVTGAGVEFGKLAETMDKLAAAIGPFIEEVGQALRDAGSQIGTDIRNAGSELAGIISQFRTTVENIPGAIQAALRAELGGLGAGLQGSIAGAFESVLSRYLTPRQSGADFVPGGFALLHYGEMVLNARAAERARALGLTNRTLANLATSPAVGEFVGAVRPMVAGAVGALRREARHYAVHFNFGTINTTGGRQGADEFLKIVMREIRYGALGEVIKKKLRGEIG
jgi:TP901 family phage tail tape measure protein